MDVCRVELRHFRARSSRPVPPRLVVGRISTFLRRSSIETRFRGKKKIEKKKKRGLFMFVCPRARARVRFWPEVGSRRRRRRQRRFLAVVANDGLCGARA